MSEAIKPIGQLTNIRQVSDEQLQTAKTLRRLENQQFNPNVSGHTNPALRDPGKVVEETGPKNAPSGTFNHVANVNVNTPESSSAPQDISSVASAVSMNTSLKSPVGGKISSSA